MAAEAAPPPSFEAPQHHEEIDYSEDDAAGPTDTAQGSNHNSFSANSHFVADGSENVEVALDLYNETADVEVAPETMLVADDARPEGTGLESVGAGMYEDATLVDQISEEAGDDPLNDNEITWEDGLQEEQAGDHDYDQPESDKGDWQLVDESEQLAGKGQDSDDGAPARVSTGQETGQIPDEHADIAAVAQVYAQETGTSIAEESRDEEAGAQDSKDELNDEGREDQVIANAEAEARGDLDADEAHPETYALGHETPSVILDDGASDHANGDGPEPVANNEAENPVVLDGDNDAQVQNLDREANDEAHVEAGDDALTHEQMDYEDEVLADVQSVDTPSSSPAPVNEDGEIPVITVSYKGVEYPFFYNSSDSEGKECFFDDLSLLHCTMEGVLAGFRQELASELGPFDELVFQIDELGLEFAESSKPEVLGDTTLAQIFSVFQTLVKNQDPSGSKPLYAMLSTRPDCMKRWASLVDDAYNGKGLDEVSYYFASQAHSEAAEPEIMDDEPGMVGEEDNADAEQWANSPAEGDHGDQDDVEGQNEPSEANGDDAGIGAGEDDTLTPDITQDIADEDTLNAELTAVEDQDVEATMVDTDGPSMGESTAIADVDNVGDDSMPDTAEDQEPQTSGENGKAESSLALPCYHLQFCICTSCTSTFAADQMAEEDDFAYALLVRTMRRQARQHGQDQLELSSRQRTAQGIPFHSRFRHLHSCSDVRMTFSSTANADDILQVPEIDPANILDNWDTEEVDLLNAVEDAQQLADDEDGTAIVDQIIEGTDENSANKVTPNTSATSTLNGDEATVENNELDMNADIPGAEDHGADIDGQVDELAEIDWREFPGQGEDDGPESPSVFGKRPRSDVDDMLDDEDQKGMLPVSELCGRQFTNVNADVKRRRS
ncbi:conserved glutamic acid-rich protein [Colletotrichum plurivorum]|uniref:Conserved glutamic acid-rich protein n=1 Tax=Colletotrichum plurivorum TaxID=2175906 RepID=A0A8H6KVK7_9PEZI|nr:conserved glutamic acid-rich protein [Colletotrichum plurivorum]